MQAVRAASHGHCFQVLGLCSHAIGNGKWGGRELGKVSLDTEVRGRGRLRLAKWEEQRHVWTPVETGGPTRVAETAAG